MGNRPGWPGLLPDGFPVSLSANIQRVPSRFGPQRPLAVVLENGEIVFFEREGLTERELVIGKAASEAGRRDIARRIPLPRNALERRPEHIAIARTHDGVGVAIGDRASVLVVLLDSAVTKVRTSVRVTPGAPGRDPSTDLNVQDVAIAASESDIAVVAIGKFKSEAHWYRAAFVSLSNEGRVQSTRYFNPGFTDPDRPVRIAWMGDQYGVVAGGVGKAEKALGVWRIGPVDGGAISFVQWMDEPRRGEYETGNLQYAGALRWGGGQLHLAVDRQPPFQVPLRITRHVVHAAANGTVEIEDCGLARPD